MITLADYRTKFEEHDQVSDGDVLECIQYANDDVSPEYLGNAYKRALLYYAAHYVQTDYASSITIEDGGASLNIDDIKKLKMDKIEVEFKDSASSLTSSDSPLKNTKYGRQYLSLVDNMAGPVTL